VVPRQNEKTFIELLHQVFHEIHGVQNVIPPITLRLGGNHGKSMRRYRVGPITPTSDVIKYDISIQYHKSVILDTL
jgi:hypothetical protein